MKASSYRADTARAALDAVASGNELPSAGAVRLVPLYSSAQYVDTVGDWMEHHGDGTPGKYSVGITLNQGRQVSAGQFGQAPGKTGLSFSFVPWITFGSGDSSRGDTLSKVDLGDNDVSITMTYDAVQACTVQTGMW